MTPLSHLRAEGARRAFAAEVGRAGATIRLEYAALLIAAEDEAHREIDVAEYLSRFETLATEARERVAQSKSSAIAAYNDFIFEELGFTGNQLDYYDPRNSFLNHVLDRRVGIPITLALIYMAVGRRAGFKVEGVGMPGHFIVRIRSGGETGSTLVDPFHGTTLEREDCQDRLDATFGGEVALTEEHLRPASTREILARMLTNLKTIYTRATLYRQALSAVERILLLTPTSPTEHRDRGSLLAQLDELPEAIKEAQLYLQLAPAAPDALQVREQLKALQIRQAMLN
jgi:regulator of sirC expression with transglutaminase-like and TPR domain